MDAPKPCNKITAGFVEAWSGILDSAKTSCPRHFQMVLIDADDVDASLAAVDCKTVDERADVGVDRGLCDGMWVSRKDEAEAKIISSSAVHMFAGGRGTGERRGEEKERIFVS